jgi:F0F1-type ATP synthase assembly protein I
MRDDERRPDADRPREDELSISSFAGVGLQFAIAIVIFLYAGKWVDSKLGTAPAFLITGVFLGAGVSFYNLYRKISAAQKADDARRAAKR